MKFFNKSETIMLIVVFMILIVISVPNFILSVKRSRDLTRKDDLGEIVHILDVYAGRYKEYPASHSGKIVACAEPDVNIDEHTIFKPCEWGEPSSFGEIPSDPDKNLGVEYAYISNGKRYQLFGVLEAHDDEQYNKKIVAREINCGTKICNFGRGNSNTPLDKSLEEYENELLEIKKL